MPARILIADDAAFMRVMIKGILEKQNYEIVGEAKDGKEAIEMYKNLKPDLTTMDIIMPEVNGIEAVKEIIQVDSKAVIIMCSAMGQQAMVIEAIAAGAKDFVIKPFQPPRVLEAVERALAK
ncbi:response regulator [bacterium]|nr:response regulator [bacterium]